MRIILPFVCLILYTQSLISQNLNIAGHDGVDASGDMVSINSKSYYLGNSMYGCDYSNAFLKCINDSGIAIATHTFGTHGVTFFGPLIKTFDDALLLTGNSSGSYDIGPYEECVMKMDTNGTILFQTFFSGADFFPRISCLTQHIDSSFYFIANATLYHLSKTGQFIPQTNLGLTQIRTVKALLNGNLLVNASVNSIWYHLIITPTGSVISQQSSTNVVKKYIECPNYILALSNNGYIEKMSSGLGIQANSAMVLNPAIDKINDLIARNDSIFVAGTSTSLQKPFYAILDSNFTSYFHTTAPYKGIKPTGISITNKNAIHIISTSTSKSSSDYSFISMYRFNLLGTFHSVSDIGLTGFQNLNTRLFGNNGSPNWTTMSPFIEMDVTVKNFGSDTVKSFYINYYSFMGGISYCNLLLHKKIETPIAPGALITVPTGSFFVRPFSLLSGTTSAKLNICIFTTVPNASNDIEIDNDSYCDSVLFTVTGISENSLLEQSIQVYPNPSSGGFTIDSDVEIKTLELINVLGEIVKQERINAKEYYLDELALSPGIYFIKLETEKGSVQKKVIKH